jgi:hypothetical protein
MEDITLRKVKLENMELEYHLERKNVKNLNLRIRKDGTVYVSASNRIAATEIDVFIKSKETYICNAIARFKELEQFKPAPKKYVSGETFYMQGRALRLQVSSGKKNEVDSDGVYIYLSTKTPEDFDVKQRMMTRFLDRQCKDVFSEILNYLYPILGKYGVAMPKLRIRDMETRWGSCLAKKGVITLNKRLLEAPRSCIEYVVMHELCHFVHPNHSKQFYGFLTMLMPDWKERKHTLDKSAEFWL